MTLPSRANDTAMVGALLLKLGSLTVLPRHWWEGVDKSGKRHNITQTTLDPPLGSGPYRIKMFDAGRSIVYERVKNYWGKSLPANIGTNNFDELRFDYFRDPSVGSRHSNPGPSIGASKTPRKIGQPNTTFRQSEMGRSCWRNFRSEASEQCRRSPSTPAARNSGIRGYGAPSISRSISKRSIGRFSSASIHGFQVTSMAPSWRRPACRKVVNSNSCRRSAQRFRPRYSPALLESG